MNHISLILFIFSFVLFVLAAILNPPDPYRLRLIAGGLATATAAFLWAGRVFGIILLGSFLILIGCAVDPATGRKVLSPASRATLAVIEQQAIRAAQQAVLSLAVNAVDKNFKGDYLDSVASGLESNIGSIVTAGDVTKIVQAWAPSSGGPVWENLAGQLASIYEQQLAVNGPKIAAQVVDQLARGLNAAAHPGL